MTTAEVKAAKQIPLAFLFRDWLFLPLAAVVFAVDQGTKELIERWIQLYDSVHAWGPLEFAHTSNTGTAFGLFPNQTLVLTIASFIAIGVLLIFRNQFQNSIWLRLSLGLQLGGAVGNLADRLVQGYVTDFIHITIPVPVIGSWPVFNVADMGVVGGLGILFWMLFTQTSPRPTQWRGAPYEYRLGSAPDPGC